MRNKIFCHIAILIFAAAIIFSSSADAKGVWRLDGDDSYELPRNFRIVANLNSSASGQPSLNNLSTLYNEIKKSAAADAKIYMLDLRQESHGFADAYPASWYIQKNLANFGRSKSKIEKDESKRLKKVVGKLTTFTPLGNEDKARFKPIEFSPRTAQTEREAAEKIGFRYVRFTATDMMFPAPEVVDEFINFVGTLRENDWLHFHCHAGHGRTTNFLVMYELLKSPNASLEEICERQKNLGGSDLLSNSNYSKNIRLFRKYAQEVHEKNISTTWSEFLAKEI